MPVDIRQYIPTDADAAARRTLNTMAGSLGGSQILAVAYQVADLRAQGREVCNLTVGDFDPAQFRVPDPLTRAMVASVEAGHTNYPPSIGLLELRQAIAKMYADELGILYPAEAIICGSGARPGIFAAWQMTLEPGDVSVSFVPAWNNGYYAHLFQTEHRFVRTTAEHNFFPTVEQVERILPEARLIILNSPLNPTGTAIDRQVLADITQAIVDENKRRGDRRPVVLVYDQVYWKLTFGDVVHHNPVALVPESAPYVIHIDAISKWFCGTGLRLGWAVIPPFLQKRHAGLVGHMGAWAPRPVQEATAAMLADRPATDSFVASLRKDVLVRLDKLYHGLMAMKDRGLPVDAIPPQGAIYLSFRLDLIGRGFDTNEQIRNVLLEEAGVAVVPFQAFDLREETGWFRMSVGAVGLEELDGALERLEALLRRRMGALA